MVQVVTPGNLGPDFSLGGEIPSKVTVVPASDSVPGKTRYATSAEAAAGAADNAALTPAVLLGAMNALLAMPANTIKGATVAGAPQNLTPDQVAAMILGNAAAKALLDALYASLDGTGKVPIAQLPLAGILSGLLGIDGAGSGLDADLLDGQHGAFYQNASNLNAGTVPAAQLPAYTGDVTKPAGSTVLTLSPAAVLAAIGCTPQCINEKAVANGYASLDANTRVTFSQRGIIFSTIDPTAGDGVDGDVWYKYI